MTEPRHHSKKKTVYELKNCSFVVSPEGYSPDIAVY